MINDTGSNNYKFFTSSMRRSLEERASLQRLLYSALANDEFVIHYQPQIDLRTGHMFGVEALIRWAHPKWLSASGGESAEVFIRSARGEVRQSGGHEFTTQSA